MDEIRISSNDEFKYMADIINENVRHIQGGLERDNKMIDELSRIVSVAVNGELGHKLSSEPNNVYLKNLKELLNNFLENLTAIFKQATSVLQTYAANDFTKRIDPSGAIKDKLELIQGI
ncbi:MAG: methyl-accepting chemotaxis protein, partial [Helicobacteraceae bacterium]